MSPWYVLSPVTIEKRQTKHYHYYQLALPIITKKWRARKTSSNNNIKKNNINNYTIRVNLFRDF